MLTLLTLSLRRYPGDLVFGEPAALHLRVSVVGHARFSLLDAFILNGHGPAEVTLMAKLYYSEYSVVGAFESPAQMALEPSIAVQVLSGLRACFGRTTSRAKFV